MISRPAPASSSPRPCSPCASSSQPEPGPSTSLVKKPEVGGYLGAVQPADVMEASRVGSLWKQAVWDHLKPGSTLIEHTTSPTPYCAV